MFFALEFPPAESLPPEAATAITIAATAATDSTEPATTEYTRRRRALSASARSRAIRSWRRRSFSSFRLAMPAVRLAAARAPRAA